MSSDPYDKNLYAYCDNNPVTRVDSNGAAWHIAIGAGVGAIAGLVGQVVSDIITSSLNRSITISNWQTYTGAITTGVGATLEKRTINNYDKSWGEIAVNTVLDGAVSYGLGKLPGVNKITAGRGNQSAVYRSGLTKMRKGVVSRMSSRVVMKGIKSSIVGGGPLDIYYGVKQHSYNRMKSILQC